MQQLMAYGTAAMTVGLVLGLPRTRIGARFGPVAAAALGVIVMLAAGILSPPDLAVAAETLWRPFVALLSIMLTASVAERFGVLRHFAALIEPRCVSVARTFSAVFLLSVVMSAVLNNDAAVLLLTPVVIELVRRRYPGRTDLIVPFAFAVFAAAGVAPLVISNPMNLVVADLAGIDFNEYALRMIPIALAGWITAFVTLRVLFYRTLRAPEVGATQHITATSLSAPAKQFLALMAGSLISYPILTLLGGPIWIVAAVSAALGVSLALYHRAGSSAEFARAVSWETLAFLFCVFVMAVGLRHVGFVDVVAEFYGAAEGASQIALVGVSAALGSAVLNNHPMAIINALAIGSLSQPHQDLIFAALIGGDLGPRLLPMGSLAALLWLDQLRRHGVQIAASRFILIGIPLTAAALTVSLTILIGTAVP